MKTTIHAATPTRRDIDILRHPRDDMLHLSPSKLFSPTAHLQPAMLGPTPQKDGIVLGLFDLLPTESPSKQRTVLGDIAANRNLQTPQKRKASGDDDDDDDDELQWSGKMARMGRTPVSEGKRHFLDQFATPQKRRHAHDAETPSSRRSGGPDATTPVFLRRSFVRPMPTLAEQSSTGAGAPKKPRSFTRTLSTILQERRREKEDDAKKEAEAKRQAELEAEAAERENDPDDDEEEAMREMEGGFAPASAPKPSTVLVEDSQFDMKLGADGENFSDSEPSEHETNGQSRRVWKKKGAKRQTRRVTMRPVRSKPPPQQQLQTDNVGSEDESDDTVAETQHAAAAAAANQGEPASEDFNDSDSTAVGDEDDYASEHGSPKKRKVQSGSKKQTKAQEPPTKKPAEKEGVVKKAARKISAQAHANFRRLKIKNKNSKANGRGWGRNRR